MHDPHALKIYIDGSAYRNPGHEGGLAGIAEFPDSLDRLPEIIFVEGFDRTTNNRMELRACIRALEYVCENAKMLGILRAIILTDSQYVNDFHTLAPSWRREGWRNRHGRPIENKELWRQFLSVRSRTPIRVDIDWNLGKSTPILKIVDKAAKSAAKGLLKRKDFGYRPGKISPHRTENRGAATLFPANQQDLVIRVYAHRVVGKECRVSFTMLSNEGGSAEKYFAYVTGSGIGEIHRHKCYRVRFNGNPNYPVFEILELFVGCPAP